MRILLVLAGDPPEGNLLSNEIAKTNLTIAVDGGANVFHQNNLTPDILIGDIDSAIGNFNDQTQVIRRSEQSTTDLQKTLTYVLQKHHPEELVLLGATGGRSDHFINNLQICASIDPDVNISLKNNKLTTPEYSSETIIRITPSSDNDHQVNKGSTMSIMSVSQFKGLSSTGLLWEIQNGCSENGFFSQSNLAQESTIHINLFMGCVYLAVYQ